METRAAGTSLPKPHWGPGPLGFTFSSPVHFLVLQVRIPINFSVWRSLGCRGEAWGKRWLRRHVFIKSNEAVVRSLHLGLIGIPPDGSLNKQCGGENTADPADREAEYELCRSREPADVNQGRAPWRALSFLSQAPFPTHNQSTSYQRERARWFLFLFILVLGIKTSTVETRVFTPGRQLPHQGDPQACRQS